MSTHLYVLQLNARLGDFEGNLARALEILNTRFEGFSTAEDPQGTARVVIFPQGAFSGLMPLAAYRWEDVQTREANALRELTRWVKAHGLTALVPMSARLYAIDPDGTVHPYELSGGSIAAGESVLVWGRAVQAVEAKRSIYVDFGRAERLLDAPTSEETAQDLARYFVGEPSKDALSANERSLICD